MIPAAVGFGGNVGRPDLAFAAALRRLEASPGVRVRAVSSLYRSAAWGLEDQPDFLNAVAVLATDLSPRDLLGRLREEERRAGRVPGPRWAPRPLDLDLLWHGERAREEPGLVLPHPGIPERTFVLEPLAEVRPGWRHPVTGLTPARMLAALRASGRATPCTAIPGAALGEPAGAPACLG